MALTREDWEEIYNSLDSKLWLLKTNPGLFIEGTPDPAWVAQIERIMEHIGLDGEDAFNRQEKT